MTPDDLRLDTEGNALVARVTGEVDLSNAEKMGTRIAEATAAEFAGVVLDLTDVTYLDSYGIYVMFGLRERLVKGGQAMALVVPRDSPVQRALQIGSVSDRIQIAEAVSDALLILASKR